MAKNVRKKSPITRKKATRERATKKKATRERVTNKKAICAPKSVCAAAKRQLSRSNKQQAADAPVAEQVSISTPSLKKILGRCRATLQEAIHCLRVSPPENCLDELLHRENEIAHIMSFVRQGGAKQHGPPTLQIFGMPGTGKTAAVSVAIQRLQKQPVSTVTHLYLNGFVLQRASDIFCYLWAHLQVHRLGKRNVSALDSSPESAAADIDKRFRTQGWGARRRDTSTCVIVLDEADKLCLSSPRIVFTLVDWMTLPYAHCKLITIANSLHLPEKVDAKIRSRLNTTQRVTFQAYTADQLEKLLKQRLSKLQHQPPVFRTNALQFLCRNVAGHNGDVRRLLQVASNAVLDVLCKIEHLIHTQSLPPPSFLKSGGKSTALSSKVNSSSQRHNKGLVIANNLRHNKRDDGDLLVPEFMNSSSPTTELTREGTDWTQFTRDGMVDLQHVNKCTRVVLSNQFGEFVNAVVCPVRYLVLVTVAAEMRVLHSLGKDFSIDTEKIFRKCTAFFCAHRSQFTAHLLNTETNQGNIPYYEYREDFFTFEVFAEVLEVLRRVGYLEVSFKEGGNNLPLHDARVWIRTDEETMLTIMQPFDIVLTLCQVHGLFRHIFPLIAG